MSDNDLIRRVDVYDALCKICNERNVCEKSTVDVCHRVFATIPAVDAVDVVRCKDCKWYDFDDDFCLWFGCPSPSDENGFCSHGERKTDNE